MKTILAFPYKGDFKKGYYSTSGFGDGKEIDHIHLHDLLTKGYQIVQRNEDGTLLLRKGESKGHRTKTR